MYVKDNLGPYVKWPLYEFMWMKLIYDNADTVEVLYI
jgi:hypothetical protein